MPAVVKIVLRPALGHVFGGPGLAILHKVSRLWQPCGDRRSRTRSCAQQRVVIWSPRRRKRPAVSSSPARTTSDCSELTNLNQGGLSYPLQEAPNGFVDGICGQLCNSAWPVRYLTISDGLYNFSELRGADRAARSCSPARAPTSVPPHPAIDSDATVYLAGFGEAKSRLLSTVRREPLHRQRSYRGHHGPRENLEASL